ncbi:hypothetical protein CMI37_10280 [Candidatus Pacearchaeota archaeon]|nr:hypothetical protein [Candidatus Pacearchaeota archaeon]|tara:strand:- start:484 stop:873 length:390 start_codon:yes stop_codon:yes gene_type:complete
MAGTVQNIFDSLYTAIVEAQKAVEEHYSENIRQTYFDSDGTPKTVKMNLNGKEVSAPLFSLVPHNSLKIESCEIDLELNLDHDGEEALGCLGKLRKGQMANIKIKFSSTNQAEGLARVGDNLTKLIPTI